jgi:hypothetical protein
MLRRKGATVCAMTIDIDSNANKPRRGKNEQGEFEQHPLKDQIAADRYVKEQSASDTPWKSMRHAQMRPPGATG